MSGLEIGTAVGAPKDLPVVIPLDEVTKATAILGIRETGKSCLGTVFAEELCKARQPWISLDPVGNWWGLRAKPDGRPGGYPVVVFGGERGDLPLEKGDGRRIAEAVISANVFAVIDLKRTSKTIWRTLVRDFVSALLELQPETPRKVFLEEAPEFIPQTASYQLGRECSEIVERLVTLGGNYGYGATLLGQRVAAIAKNALLNCETVFAFAAQGHLDRKAYSDWIRSMNAQLRPEMLDELADLPTGTCWLWSPRFLKVFQKIQIRRRETFHPRDARKLKVAVRDVELAPVDEFVQKVRKQLTKSQATVAVHLAPDATPKTKRGVAALAEHVQKKGRSWSAPAGGHDVIRDLAEIKRRVLADTGAPISGPMLMTPQAADELQRMVHEITAERDRLRQELAKERAQVGAMALRLEAVKKIFRPDFEKLRGLFDDQAPEISVSGSAGHVPAHYEPWLEKAGSGVNRRLLETVIKHRELTRTQLATFAVVGPRKTAFRDGLSWLRRNGLIETEGDVVRLKAV